MEGLFEGLGIVALVVLAVVGLGVGWIAGALTGRNKAAYAAIGAVAALATPFLLLAFGVTALAAGGLQTSTESPAGWPSTCARLISLSQ